MLDARLFSATPRLGRIIIENATFLSSSARYSPTPQIRPTMFGTILSAMGFSNNTIIAEIPNLTNKIALVTGGNTGIGLITCEELSAKGAKVYLAARSAERANAAIAQVKSKQPEAKIEFLPFDMTDVISARKAAQVIIDKETRLDIVGQFLHSSLAGSSSFGAGDTVANAGVMAFPYKLVNGVEVQFVSLPFFPLLSFYPSFSSSVDVLSLTLRDSGTTSVTTPSSNPSSRS